MTQIQKNRIFIRYLLKYVRQLSLSSLLVVGGGCTLLFGNESSNQDAGSTDGQVGDGAVVDAQKFDAGLIDVMVTVYCVDPGPDIKLTSQPSCGCKLQTGERVVEEPLVEGTNAVCFARLSPGEMVTLTSTTTYIEETFSVSCGHHRWLVNDAPKNECPDGMTCEISPVSSISFEVFCTAIYTDLPG